ncbi:MAG: FmdE family protein [Syntrophobacteraceae bacterium]
MTTIGPYSYEEFVEKATAFHGYPAPGILIGGFMVDLALSRMDGGLLIDAISETPTCLPDAIQLLTPCTFGNGWLKVFNLGRFALSLYEKYEGEGVRVYLDPKRLEAWTEIKTWLYKLKLKREQDTERLLDEIRRAGNDICSIQQIRVETRHLGKKSRGAIGSCPSCGEPYPLRDGGVCRGCQGENPYISLDRIRPEGDGDSLPLRAVPAAEAVGKHALHDMTRILPGESKGPAFRKGQEIGVGDLCRLQQMGRSSVYVLEDNTVSGNWVHEDEAASTFARAMAGPGLDAGAQPREGRVDLIARHDGLLMVNENRLLRFNSVPGVICASRRAYTLVAEGRAVAATRAIPLFLPRSDFQEACEVLEGPPLFEVLPLRKLKAAILITGNEVFQGLIEDRFLPIISSKLEKLGSTVAASKIVPDDQTVIAASIAAFQRDGIELLVTTAGLSVDPDDVTRQGLLDAGAKDLLYGAPIVPGGMILVAHIGEMAVIGVPACALHFRSTSFDLILPRVLAGAPITKRDLAMMGHGGLCLGCKTCTFPKCPFGG